MEVKILMAEVFTILIPAKVLKMNMKMRHGTEWFNKNLPLSSMKY